MFEVRRGEMALEVSAHIRDHAVVVEQRVIDIEEADEVVVGHASVQSPPVVK